jgi:hypothetical protein
MAKVNWSVKPGDFEPTLDRFERYLHGQGMSENSAGRYITLVNKFLKFAGDSHPGMEQAMAFSSSEGGNSFVLGSDSDG